MNGVNMSDHTLTVGSLFAGVGGICLGFKQAFADEKKYEVVWANEIDKFACETYRNNFKHPLIEGDLYKVLNPSLARNDTQEYEYYQKMHDIMLSRKIDVLAGGFPCQAFSIAGERKGFMDERGNLFLAIVDLIQQLGRKHGKPRYLFLENVKNLMNHDDGNTYKTIKVKLRNEGYIITEIVLNTMDYTNLPQNRERIYIIGFKNQADYDQFKMFENIDNYKKNKSPAERKRDVQAIIDYNEEDMKYFYTKDKYPHYYNEEINIDEQIKDKYQFYQLRRVYIRHNKSNVCPTLTANMGTGGHNVPLIKVDGGVRKITPAEAFRLQGFPVGNDYKLPIMMGGKKYGDSNLYKQAGNAVSVPVIKMIATELLSIKSTDVMAFESLAELIAI
jgi:DNA (cytosine-5)-methyltransferase 1